MGCRSWDLWIVKDESRINLGTEERSADVSHNLNSLKGGYIGDYIVDY